MKTLKSSVIITFVLIVGLALILTACGCNHEWLDATCISPKTCNLCGATEGEKIEHNYVYSSCLSPEKCSVCGDIKDFESVGHNFVNGICSRCKAEDPDSKLSNKFDEILATGRNSNGDYYEIVANKSEDYTGLSFLIGVIKNNEWLLEPTKDMPFIAKENTFNWNKPETGEIFYVGNNCFVSIKKSTGGSNSPFASYAYMYIVYNVETGKSYSTANYSWSNKKQVPLIESNNEDYMIIGYESYYGSQKIIILNKNDMSVSTIEINNGMDHFSPISENLFCLSIGTRYYFYDLKGNMILDLSEYKATKGQTVCFKNGKCQIEITNDNGTKYKLTIDKEGNVLSSVAA